MARKLLSSFDPRARVAVAGGLAALAGAFGYYGLSVLMIGPWYAILFSAGLVAVCVSGAAVVWPEKTGQLPGGLEAAIDRFQKQKGRATKTAAGRVFWCVGRAAVVATVASYVLHIAGPMPDLVSKLLVGGFALAVGFFGLRAGLVAGTVVFLLAHRLTLAGLNVDIADPVSRAGFIGAWGQGWAISWWWPLGVLALVPAWVGLAAAANICGGKVSEVWAEYCAAVETKRKIENRRRRLRIAKDQSKQDPVAVAGKEREAAAQRVAAIARGAEGQASPEESQRQANSTGDFVAKASEELKGVDKLTDANIRATLLRYIEHVREINEQQAQGIDLDTVTRRGFDRLVQAMSDAQIRYLREGKVDGAEILLAYYNRLCGLEAAVVTGGDGEIVAAQLPQLSDASPDPDSIRDVLDGSSPDGGSSANTGSAAGRLGPGFVKVKRSGHLQRIFDEGESGEPMLASATKTALTLNPDGSPQAAGPLPMAPSEAETASNENSSEPSDETGDPEAGDEEQDTTETKTDTDDDTVDVLDRNEVAPAVPGSTGASAQGDDTVDVLDSNEVAPATSGSSGPDKSAQGAGEGDINVDGSRGEPQVDEEGSGEGVAASPRSEDSNFSGEAADEAQGKEAQTSAHDGTAGDAADDPSREKPTASANDGETGAEDSDGSMSTCKETANGDEQEAVRDKAVKDPVRHHAAGAILAGKIDREFVLQTKALFSCARDLAEAIELSEDMVAERYAIFAALRDGACVELELVDQLAAQSEAGIRGSLKSLEGSPWEPDPDLIKRATSWLAENSEEARLKREVEARAEEERASAAAQAAAERAEQERLQGEKAEQEEREKELKRRAYQIAGHILVGVYEDDILDAAGDLFPDAQSLADAMGLKREHVEDRFADFDARRRARQRMIELRCAVQASDLLSVKAMLKDVESFKAHPDAADALQKAEAWVKGEEAKQQIEGLNDRVFEPSGSANEESGRLFLKRLLKVTDEQAMLIETELPRYLTVAANLRQVIEMMGEGVSEAVWLEHDKAMAAAAAVAAKIVAQEKPCRDYANAYFPKEHRHGDVWEMLVKLADGNQRAKETGSEQKPEQNGEVEQEADQNMSGESLPASSQLLQAPLPVDVASRQIKYEETQKINVKEYFASIEKGGLESWDQVSRRYKRLCYTILPNGTGGDFISTDDKNRTCYLRLPDMEGCIRIHTEYSKVPFLCNDAEKKVYVVDTDQGNIGTSYPSDRWQERLRGMFVNGEERKDRVRGIIYVSPYIRDDGITSFERLLNEVQEGPVMICNNDLSSDQISAFVERVKGARG